MADEAQAPGRDGEPDRPAELRASHEDRDRVVELLQVAAGDGRLTPDELDERLEAALTARTHSELAVLTADLPAAGAAAAGQPPPQPKDLVRIQCGDGSVKRDGRWVVPQSMQVQVSNGSITLDFTDAVIAVPLLKIAAQVGNGSLRLVTKPGIVVDTDDVTIRSGSAKVVAPWDPGVPVTLRVEVSGKVGNGSITARPPRRTFWQWLLRRPRYALTGR